MWGLNKMGCDYVVRGLCDFRKSMPEQALHELFTKGMLQEKYDRSKPGTTITREVFDGVKVTRKDLKLESCQRAAVKIHEMEVSACGKCKFNVDGKGLGCYGRIDYPISRDLEDFLAMCLQEIGARWSGDEPSRFMAILATEYGMRGGTLRARTMRRRPEIMAENQPIILTMKGFPRDRFDMDWFWEAFFFPRGATFGQQVIYSPRNKELNAEFAREYIAFVDREMANPASRPLKEEAHVAIHQFTRFCKSIVLAKEHSVNFELSP